MSQRGLFPALPLIICQILMESLATSQGSLKVIIENSTDPIVVERNTTSEIYFSLSDISDTTLNYIVMVSHRPLRENVSRLKCFLNKSLESCSSRATYADCQCVTEDGGLTFRLRKDFQLDDNGEWIFVISGKGFSVNKTVNISVVSRPPKLIIGNHTGYFMFEANKTSEIRFSVEDVASYILSYTLFINHKAPGTDISRLKCYLIQTNDSCKSSSADCLCLHRHQYKMLKAFREEDCGEWNFSVAGLGFSVKNGVHVSIVAQSPETNQSAELCKLPEKSLLTLTIDNTAGPFVFEHNSVSEVCFSVDHVENKLLSYTITINHKAFGTHVSELRCYLSKTLGECTSSDEDCECLKEKAGHQYRLKTVFDYEDSGEWTFTVFGQGLSFERTINITVIPGSRGGNAQNETTNGNEGERTSKKSDSSTSSPGQAAGNGSKSGGSTPRSSSSGSDKPSTNPNYTSTALQEVEIHPYMDLHTRDPTYASTTSSKDPHMYMELKTLRAESKSPQQGSGRNGNDGYETPRVPGQGNQSSDGYETPQPPREERRRSALYANQGRSDEPIQEEVNYYNEA